MIDPVLTAWRLSPIVPEGLARAMASLIAHLSWLRGSKKSRQLQANLARVMPGASRWELRNATLKGVVAYLRYYAEIFTARRLTQAMVDARVRMVGHEPIKAAIAAGKVPVLALAHLGNWDYAGAFASKELAPLTTVAERLSHQGVFEEFCQMRAALGMTIIPADTGQAFRQLLRAAKGPGPRFIALLADRDLSARGVDIELFGETVRVAAGPAALACAADVPLFPAAMVSEKLTGKRRRAARTRHGYAVIFHPEVPRRPDLPAKQEVQAMTEAWMGALAPTISVRPWDWHMLQKVFVADLDTAKDAEIRGTQ
jgi:KDO2-lipid IV(A) lauroyltransferase